MAEMNLCQSCSMPMTAEVPRGTNVDGSENNDYCKYCYENGTFTDGLTRLEDYTEYSLQFAGQAGMTEEQMRAYCKEVLPTLKRWREA